MDRVTRAFYASSAAAGLSVLAMFLTMLIVSSPSFSLEERRAEIQQQRLQAENFQIREAELADAS